MVEKTEIDALLDKWYKIDDKLKEVDKCVATLKEHGVNVNTRQYKAVVGKYKDDLSSLSLRIAELHRQWKDVCDNCDHEWDEVGHDSHHVFYRCRICGMEYTL